MTTALNRIGGLAIGAAIAAACPAAAAEGGTLRLSNGHEIVMAPAGSMDCPALARKLDEIDDTGYRGNRPRPRNAADMPLLHYENRVSNRYYSDCMRQEEGGGSGGAPLFPGRFKTRGKDG